MTEVATIALMAVLVATSSDTSDPPVVALEARVEPSSVQAGHVIPVTLVVTNHLPVALWMSCLATTPSTDDSETMGVELAGVLREGAAGGSIPIISRPAPGLPHAVPMCVIGPDETYTLKTEISKWGIEGGWIPGSYIVSLRILGLHAGPYVRMDVSSSPTSFEVR